MLIIPDLELPIMRTYLRRSAAKFSMGLSIVLLAVWMVNWIGFNLFLYLDIGQKDAILGASRGVIHIAVAEPSDMTDEEYEELWGRIGDSLPFDSLEIGLIDVGPLNIFLERRLDPMYLLRFHLMTNEEYAGFDFPTLPFAVTMAALAYYLRREPNPSPPSGSTTDG